MKKTIVIVLSRIKLDNDGYFPSYYAISYVILNINLYKIILKVEA